MIKKCMTWLAPCHHPVLRANEMTDWIVTDEVMNKTILLFSNSLTDCV